MTASESVKRIRIILGFVLLATIVIVARLYLVQIVQGSEYVDRADEQYVKTTGNLFDRGKIYFQNKSELFPAATLTTGYTIAINPKSVTDADAAYATLSKYLPTLDRREFLSKAAKKDDPYEVVADQVSKAVGDALMAEKISGVNAYLERWRYYPGGSLASHVLGFVSDVDGELTGNRGIEEEYNEVLTRADNDLYVNFFAEAFAGLRDKLAGTSDDTSMEGDVELTIELDVQRELEKELHAAHEKWNTKSTAGIIINPQTGEIYAMAIDPSYDLNNFGQVDDSSVYFNSLVEGVYEMGSIIKPITMASGLDAGVITPSTTYNDTGTVMIDGRRISNYDFRARGVVPMQEVLNQSLNVGAAWIEEQLGNERFADYMKKFGFFDKAGVDLPNESTNLVSTLESKQDVDYATAAFGQGPAYSAMTTVRALSALVNGGVLVTPHVVKKIDYKIGTSKTIEPEITGRAISPETSETIQRMLVKVVDEALMGGTVALPHYSVGAKTGTAQISGPGGYYADKFNHTYFGFFPAYDPKFLIFLVNFEPKGAPYASETLTDTFMNLVHFLITYYNVPPDR